MSEDSDDDAHGDDEDDNQHEDEIGDGKSIKWNAIKRNEFIFPFRALWPDGNGYQERSEKCHRPWTTDRTESQLHL